MKYLQVTPLQQDLFTEFGDVIEIGKHAPIMINHGQTERYHRLSDVSSQQTNENSHSSISIFRNVMAFTSEMKFFCLEQHPLGSQAFIPLHRQKFIIIVAKNNSQQLPDEEHIYAFISNGKQAINYKAGTWHHALISLEAPSDFVVVDRTTDLKTEQQDKNLVLYDLQYPFSIQL